MPLLIILFLAFSGFTAMDNSIARLYCESDPNNTQSKTERDMDPACCIPDTAPLVIVAFGNSITATPKTVNQVFAQRLSVLLAIKGIEARVINSGRPGSHSGYLSDNNIHKIRHASDRFESDVLSYQPDLVIIGFGTNDSFIDSYKPDGSSRIPLDHYQDNLTYFIKNLQDRNIKVVLIAPNPFGENLKVFIMTGCYM